MTGNEILEDEARELIDESYDLLDMAEEQDDDWEHDGGDDCDSC